MWKKNKVFDTMESLREKLSIHDNINNDGNFRNKNEEYKQVDESYEFDEFNESDKILVYDSLNNIDQKYDIHDKNNNQPKVNPVIINSENLNIETDKGAHPIEKFNKEFPKKEVDFNNNNLHSNEKLNKKKRFIQRQIRKRKRRRKQQQKESPINF